MKKKIAILGSTGSIGLTSLKVLEKKKNLFSIEILVAGKNHKEITHQIKKYKPKYFVITDKNIYEKISSEHRKSKIIFLNNFSELKINNKAIDIAIIAIPGLAGLKPTLDFIKKSKKVLLANKEAIICAWTLIKKEATFYKTQLIPIDSEHFSVSKLIENKNHSLIKNIYITASGGPFLNWKKSKINSAKLSDALKHPKWNMGKKISIDSATMMNKVFEFKEAMQLFSLPHDKLKILIHPQSLVHAIVEFKSGITKFLYHETDMSIPISNAIFEEKNNIEKIISKKNIFNKKNKLEFFPINSKKFEAFKLLKVINLYPSSSIIINGANEIFVDRYIKKKINFSDIIRGIFKILRHRDFKKYAIQNPNNLNKIYKIDNWSRYIAVTLIKK